LDNNVSFETNFEAGKMNVINKYIDGLLNRTYKNDYICNIHIDVIDYYPNGIKKQFAEKICNDKYDGKVELYDESGRLTEIKYYNDGIEQKDKSITII